MDPSRSATRVHGLLLASATAIIAGALALHREPPPTDSPGLVGVAREPIGPIRQAPARAGEPHTVPVAAGLAAARRYARRRGGSVAFAVIDTDGERRGLHPNRLYSAASTVKAMLLAAELRRLERGRLPLDDGTDALLRSMVTESENDAADSIYARVGDDGMFAVAERAGMTRFTEAGHWGNAQVSAADLARFYARLDELMAGPHREYALGLLGSVTPAQSWGIPAAARPEWAVRFKGGWLPERGLAHQAAELRDRERSVALAVMTDAQPSHEYATETIRGVAELLLSRGGGAGARSGS